MDEEDRSLMISKKWKTMHCVAIKFYSETEDEAKQNMKDWIAKLEKLEDLNDIMFETIPAAWLSLRTKNILECANIYVVGQLVQKTEAEMLKTKNCGRKSLNELNSMLKEMGLSFGMKLKQTRVKG